MSSVLMSMILLNTREDDADVSGTSMMPTSMKLVGVIYVKSAVEVLETCEKMIQQREQCFHGSVDCF